MLLFHGSNTIVKTPQLIEQTRGLDFGSGFYLTTSEDQARRFSEIIVNRRKNGNPTVSYYEFDVASAEQSLAICRFTEANAEWLEFVKDNRLRQYTGATYDIVSGAVANDDVMPTIQGYLSGLLSAEAAVLTLKTRKLVDQFCLKSNKALALLHFIKAEVLQ
ncbi:MAG: DUF3990 domain-containing protein [Oscillospiraceae bacterium]|jgi:hypothetical protein|nr:DUF3990 domain-containing protein [Oscillospiraceae bacterium]